MGTVPSPECVAAHRAQSGYTPVPPSLPCSGLMLEPEVQQPNIMRIPCSSVASLFLFPELLHSLVRRKHSPVSDFSCLVVLIKCAWSLA